MFGPLAPFLLHQVTFMNTGIVDQDNAWNRVRLERNLIEEGDHIVACRRPLLSAPGQLAVLAQGPEHIHALPVRERFDGPGLGDPALAVLHGRIWTEARVVEVHQLAPLLMGEPGRWVDHFLGCSAL